MVYKANSRTTQRNPVQKTQTNERKDFVFNKGEMGRVSFAPGIDLLACFKTVYLKFKVL